MASIREQILAHLAGLLATRPGMTFYRSREAPVTRSEGIVTLLRWEGVKVDYRASGLALHTLTATVTVIARGDVPDTVADAAVVSIYSAIMADTTLGGLCRMCIEEGTKPEFELADLNSVAVEMRFRIQYATKFGDLTVTP